MNNNPKRILVIFSGQTRNYNRDQYIWNEWKKFEQKIRDTYDIEAYDYIGHTWSDQPTIHNQQDFLHYREDDQNIIDNWVKDNIFLRAWINNQNKAWNEFYENNKEDPSAIHTKIIENSRKAYGQVWSHYLSLGQQDPEHYDLTIRCRWDCIPQLEYENITELIPPLTERGAPLYDKPWTIFDSKVRFKHDFTSYKRYNNTEGMGLPFIGDSVWITNKYSAKEYYHLDWKQQLHGIVSNRRRNDGTPSSHTLWTQMHPYKITSRFLLHGNTVKCERSTEQQEIKKELDEWSI